MYEMIKIEEKILAGEMKQAVNARELWEKLQVKSKFADWIKNRINDSQLSEGIDYKTFSNFLESGGLTKEYILSLDSAKHIAMLGVLI